MPAAIAILLAVACAAGCSTGPHAIRITSAAAQGEGTLRSAIEVANASTSPRRIVSDLTAGTVVRISEALPDLVGPGTRLEAAGLTLVDDDCRRPSGKTGCSGLVVAGPRIEVRGLVAKGFLLDGISVRGSSARGVRIRECRAVGNMDDGIGISDFAADVLVERSVFERNGFRTKGKGILVFDNAHARLRENTVRLNRDGVTISKRSQAELIGNRIVDNYDKGFGVRGARATGTNNEIARNGRGEHRYPYSDPAPNADGIRVTLGSHVELEGTRIEGNGDAGVVVLDTSTLILRGGRLRDNRGTGVHAREQARVELRGVTVVGNRQGPARIEDDAVVRGVSPQGLRPVDVRR